MVQAITQAKLAEYTPREFILLVGHGGTGKTSAILAMARLIMRLTPGATVYVIDTENGIVKLWKGKFSDVGNIELYVCKNMDDVILTFDSIVPKLKPTDWLAVESMARVWEYSQNIGYEQVTGMTKPKYLHKRLAEGARAPVTPQPDHLWQAVKDAHNRSFLDPIQMLDPFLNENGCNIIMSSTLGTQKPEGSKFQSRDRKEVKEALGLTVDIEGWARVPYYADTVIRLIEESDGYYASVLKDRGPSVDKPRFQITDYQSFWLDFIQNCRSG